MPFDITETPDGILYARAYGRGSIEEGQDMITALLERADRRPGVPVLIDLSGLDFQPRRSVAEVCALRLAGGLAHRRVAFVAAGGPAFQVARRIEALNPGGSLRAERFVDRDLAIRWLRGVIETATAADWL